MYAAVLQITEELNAEKRRQDEDSVAGWKNDDDGTRHAVSAIMAEEKRRFNALAAEDRREEARLLYKVMFEDFNRRSVPTD